MNLPDIVDGEFLKRVGNQILSAAGGGGMAAHDIVGAFHTASGLTAGQYLKALTATTFNFSDLVLQTYSGSDPASPVVGQIWLRTDL